MSDNECIDEVTQENAEINKIDLSKEIKIIGEMTDNLMKLLNNMLVQNMLVTDKMNVLLEGTINWFVSNSIMTYYDSLRRVGKNVDFNVMLDDFLTLFKKTAFEYYDSYNRVQRNSFH